MEKPWLRSYPKNMPETINPDDFSSIADLFSRSCEKFNDKKAVSNMGASLTYQELDHKTKNFAAYLQQSLGLKKGDRIAIMLPNSLQYFVTLFGALRAGLVVVNVNPLYTPRELTHQLKDAEVESIVVMANFAHTLEKSLPNLKIKNIIVTQLGDLFSFPKKQLINFVVKYVKKLVPSYHLPNVISFNAALEAGAALSFEPVALSHDDLAFLQYTGGTTGLAKGAMLTHKNIIANTLQAVSWTDGHMNEGAEVIIAPLPLYHIFSLMVSCFLSTYLGEESVLITNPRDIPGMLKELNNHNFTTLIGINTLYNALLNNPGFNDVDWSTLKIAIAGGTATSPAIASKWAERTGVHILEGYGLTETSPIISINRFDATEFSGNIGLPLPSTDVDIKDDAGTSLPLGEVGELCVKGPQVMKGYWQHPEETKSAFTDDGWLRTGDMAKLDESGHIHIVDRKKDMILVSGFNVYPNEIESVLMSHPGVLEAVVVGMPSDDTGEAVRAIIVKKDPALTEKALYEFCKTQLTNYKRPRVIEFRDELPKTPIGKILRRELRDEKVKPEDKAKP